MGAIEKSKSSTNGDFKKSFQRKFCKLQRTFLLSIFHIATPKSERDMRVHKRFSLIVCKNYNHTQRNIFSGETIYDTFDEWRRIYFRMILELESLVAVK